MIDSLSLKLYSLSPVCVQNALCTLRGRRLIKRRYAGSYDDWAKFYAESRNWSEPELREYQREQLGELLRDAWEHVPFYADRWRELGITPGDIRDLDDLPKLPAVEKDELHANTDRMISTEVRKEDLVKTTTGGSTGMTLYRYYTLAETRRHYAIWWDRMRPGVKLGDRYATFQGHEVVPARQSRPPYWRENRAANQVLYSMRHLSGDKLHHYAEHLMSERFVYYQGYVSIMTVVADYMAANGYKLPNPPKAVFTTSEQLTEPARELLESAWDTRLWDEYCQGERCAMIMECPEGNRHIQMDYGIVELEPIRKVREGELCEIVCTGFIPHASPLIRYRIGDGVVVDRGATCPCGAPGPVIKAIQGRIAHYIVTPDGRKYPHISLIVDMLRNVRGTQVVQDRPEEITVRIVPFPEYDKADEKHLVRCFTDRIGGGIGVNLQYVDELERQPNGKVLSIINRIPGHENQKQYWE